MSIMEKIVDVAVYVVTEETGILIGIGLLIWASSYLPKKVRLHVLTGGISIALYQIGKNYYFRQKYKEAEEERKRLKEEKARLEQEGNALLEELEGLKQQTQELDQQIADVRAEKERLRDQDDFSPDEFDNKINELSEKTAANRRLIDALPVIRRHVGETTHQVDSAIN
ncbi:MAG: hypothetical protein MI867_17025 [Pseudomonadales bacterium]|nr:hypothetical protein [Pseudomonadales bacterium]